MVPTHDGAPRPTPGPPSNPAAEAAIPTDSPPPPAVDVSVLWTLEDLVGYLPWEDRTVRKLVRSPHFPPAVALQGPGERRLVWPAVDVYEWVRRQPRQRPGDPTPTATLGDAGSDQIGVRPDDAAETVLATPAGPDAAEDLGLRVPTALVADGWTPGRPARKGTRS